MLRLRVRRRLSERLDGVDHGPGGSVDKLLMTWTQQAVGHAALSVSGSQAVVDAADVALKLYLYSRAQSVMGGTSQIQKNIMRPAHPRPADGLACPAREDSHEVRAPGRGARRGRRPPAHARLCRPEQLNAVNEDLHLGLTRVFPQLSADPEAHVAVITVSRSRRTTCRRTWRAS